MDSPGAAVGRRRGTPKVNAEDQALDLIAKEVCFIFFFNFFLNCFKFKCSSNVYKKLFIKKTSVTLLLLFIERLMSRRKYNEFRTYFNLHVSLFFEFHICKKKKKITKKTYIPDLS